MRVVDTLYIASTARGAYTQQDLHDNLLWSASSESCCLLLVEETGVGVELEVDDRCLVLASTLPPELPAGFHQAAALQWAIEQDLAFKQVIFVSDTCLFTNLGVGAYFLPHTARTDIGVVGVRDETNRDRAWQQHLTQLFKWRVPLGDCDKTPVTALDDFLVLTAPLVEQLTSQNLLVPPEVETWQTTYGAYLAWVSQALGLAFVSWGTSQRSLPPIYAVTAHGNYLPPPHLLHPDIAVFTAVDRVHGYSEYILREYQKKRRGAPHAQLSAIAPEFWRNG